MFLANNPISDTGAASLVLPGGLQKLMMFLSRVDKGLVHRLYDIGDVRDALLGAHERALMAACGLSKDAAVVSARVVLAYRGLRVDDVCRVAAEPAPIEDLDEQDPSPVEQAQELPGVVPPKKCGSALVSWGSRWGCSCFGVQN